MISPSSRREGRKAHLSLWAIGGKEKADLCATYLIIYLTKHLWIIIVISFNLAGCKKYISFGYIGNTE